MKKSDLKKILKPIVKECIQETLLEGGLLSSVISEVVKGIYSERPVVHSSRTNVNEEQRKQTVELNAEKHKFLEQKAAADRQRRIKILNATGFADAFEGTSPLSEGGNTQSKNNGPLSGVDPSDAGIDISGIVALGGNTWKQLIK
jgi:hypothetical protein